MGNLEGTWQAGFRFEVARVLDDAPPAPGSAQVQQQDLMSRWKMDIVTLEDPAARARSRDAFGVLEETGALEAMVATALPRGR
jgi:hypothetical protein